jgi:hypothetical protein
MQRLSSSFALAMLSWADANNSSLRTAFAANSETNGTP